MIEGVQTRYKGKDFKRSILLEVKGGKKETKKCGNPFWFLDVEIIFGLDTETIFGFDAETIFDLDAENILGV